MAFSQPAAFLYKGVIGDVAITIGLFDGAAVTSGNYNSGLSICFGAIPIPLAAAVLANQIVINLANAAWPVAKTAAQAGAVLPLVFNSGDRGLMVCFGKGF